MTASKTEFKRRLDRALGSERLRTALRRALPELRERRDARIREVDWEGLGVAFESRTEEALTGQEQHQKHDQHHDRRSAAQRGHSSVQRRHGPASDASCLF